MGKKIPYEEVSERIAKKNCILITPKEEYIDMFHDCLIMKTCGHVEYANPFSVVMNSGKWCSECYPDKPISFSRVVEKAKEKKYVLLTKEEDYKNGQTILRLICENGHFYVIRAIDFIGCNNGHTRGCNKCKGANKTIEELQKYIDDRHANEYTVLDKKYKGSKKLHLFHHKKTECNMCFLETPNSVGNKKFSCPSCSKTRVKTTFEFKKEVFDLYGGEYVVVGEYHNSKTKIEIFHNTCKTTFYTKPNSFLSQYKFCTCCNSSVGEKIIKNFLDESTISYTPQYKTEDCKNVNPLPFDFAIFKNKELYCLLEYHGIQHYEKIDWFESEKYGFEYRKKNDKIKTTYCKTHNIPLIIIPYWEQQNIYEILVSNNIC